MTAENDALCSCPNGPGPRHMWGPMECPPRSAENEADLQTLRDAAKWLQGVSEKCCECTDGHHDQRYAYGTENDVRISRDTARALVSWLNTAGADLWAHGPLCCADGCDECDDALWMPHVRRALAVARGVLTGTPIPPGGTDA